jgi:serine/threonine-protein kinase
MTEVLEPIKQALADRYTIEQEIGRGGMATVYLAHDLKHDRSVAVKVLRPELAASLGVQRFLREISVAAKLSHPHILALHDSGEAEGFLYYVMPFIEGESLRDRLNREGPLRIEEALRIAREAASALSYAHSLGFVHRDVKPENILLHHNEAVIADFGIAAAVSEAGGGRLTETGIAVGTPLYMSPEQASGSEQVTGSSDIYSLACVLFEMLAGTPPFTGPSALAIMARHARDPAPRLLPLRSAIPDYVDAAVRRALEKIPADRYGTGTEFAEALVGMDHKRGRTVSVLALIRRRVGRRFLSVAVPATVALVVTSYWYLESSPQSLNKYSVAIAYFDDLSPTGELRAIADSLTEGIIDELSVVDRIDVVSRHAVIPYRNAQLTRDSIARALNVGTVLFGSVERVGQELLVSIRLADGRTGEDIIERHGFQLPLGATKAMQDSLIQAISGAFAYWLGEDIWALP